MLGETFTQKWENFLTWIDHIILCKMDYAQNLRKDPVKAKKDHTGYVSKEYQKRTKTKRTMSYKVCFLKNVLDKRGRSKNLQKRPLLITLIMAYKQQFSGLV